jgi:hypothetical protein
MKPPKPRIEPNTGHPAIIDSVVNPVCGSADPVGQFWNCQQSFPFVLVQRGGTHGTACLSVGSRPPKGLFKNLTATELTSDGKDVEQAILRLWEMCPVPATGTKQGTRHGRTDDSAGADFRLGQLPACCAKMAHETCKPKEEAKPPVGVCLLTNS